MKGDGVNHITANSIAAHYNNKAKKDGLTGVEAAQKAIEYFKADSHSNKMKLFSEIKNKPRKARKSKKSKQVDSE